MRFILLGLFLLMPALVVAQPLESRDVVFNSEELLISVDLSSTFEIVPESSNALAQEVIVNFTLFPKDTEDQTVSFSRIFPKPAEVQDNSLTFTWDKPQIGEHSFVVSSDVTTRHRAVKIDKKVPFPVQNIPDDVKVFTQPSDYIDYEDPAIVALASALAEGEDDQFVVVHKLASWANQNIEYNLSTITADVTKSSSWVLENRQGVCDELTNLFIALNRAVGIPARFVSGISYTDSELFPERWGFHGWAEVYFPEYGWVPFDVTYGQFGFVDPGHIKILESSSVSATRTNYQWLGRNIDLKTNQLKPNILILDARGMIEPEYEINVNPLKDVVGFGSHNVVEVEIVNNKPYYVIADLLHSNTNGLTLEDRANRNVLLRPEETKYEYFNFKVDNDLQDGFIYTFPLSVHSLNVVSNSSFKSAPEARVFSLEDFSDLRNIEDETKILNRDVGIICNSDKKEYYIYEEASISCVVSNNGNVFLPDLQFCHQEECSDFTLGIGKEAIFNVDANLYSSGNNRERIFVDGNELSTQRIIEFNVLEEPKLNILNISFPEFVNFKQNYQITFMLERNTTTIPNDVQITIAPTTAKFDFPTIDNKIRVTADLNALDLEEGNNKITVQAVYHDENSRRYTNSESVSITVDDLSITDKIDRFISRLLT